MNILYEYGLEPNEAMDKESFVYFQEEIYQNLNQENHN